MKEKASAQVKALLHQSGLKAKKSLGQHFLVDEDVVECILAAAELSYRDVVVEVGPGLGVLTKRLAEIVSEVIAVELDSRLVSMLRGKLASFPNAKIIHADILKVAPQQLLEDYLATAELAQNYKVVANLPYYVASPVIHHFLVASLRPSLMVIMVQKEVGEAIAAAPGRMRLLSVMTQFYSKPTIITYVPAGSFYPSPKVDSVVLRLDIYPELPGEVSNVESFFDIVSCGFSAPRKQLRNSLAQALGISGSQVASLLEKAGIEAKRRAETLSLQEWKELWRVFAPFRR
ncbi:MAG TPA: 16S rRNA (adenine(1518)-N(6)/adenine(1519)-N(6))-dimethyltransferase RsmA [Dehalococcoidia bacterium]|nr:16S rRNA (adenine(1518)-N(6)/adenine(1519)-N(6))-dimethyltransferase RsmA [Dehalococcoidia bacterium]